MPDPTFPDYTMDELADLRPEGEEQKNARQSLMLPKGFYNSIPKSTSRLTTDKTGRRIARFTVNVEGARTQKPEEQEAVGKKGVLFPGLSWQVRKREKDGKADGFSQLYLDAQDLYNDSHQMDRANIPAVKDVLEFLENYPFGIHISQGDRDNFINRISAAKE